ncbi:unnamed protein product [Cylicostephanus goldi]|uniref:Uncharacterized protein n=1 Tax=Cylicostephanus goldi TaxID=71465 RepID=A0A3P7N9P2_CYLGO|nr:unnamed protein product [Cylicostephanus goldi]
MRYSFSFFQAKTTQSTGDSLDDYCRTLNQGADLKSKTEISMLRQKLVGLTHDAQRLEKLVKIAKPVALPELKVGGANTSGADKQAFLRKMMMIGKKRAADEKAAEKEEKEKEVKGPAGIPAHMERFKPEMEDEEEASASDEKPSSSVSSAETTEQAPSSSAEKEEEKKEPEQPVADSTTEEKPATAAPNPVSMRLKKPENPEPAKTKQQIVHDIVYGDDDKGTNVPRRSVSTDADEDEEGGGPKKKRRVRVRPNRPTTVTPGGDYGDGMDDDKYATWLPPENQSGDGKTALNEKFAGHKKEEKNQPEQSVVDSTTDEKPAAATPNPVSMRLKKPENTELVKTKQQIVHDIVYGDDDKRTNVPRRSVSTDADEDEEGGGPKKKRRVRVRPNRPTTVTPGGDYGDGMDDDKYATWLPPENQSGDGKTALNEKFAGRY